MSKREPIGPYIFQPYGMQDTWHWQTGRIYAVGGVALLTRIDGLTKDEAVRVHAALATSTSESQEAQP